MRSRTRRRLEEVAALRGVSIAPSFQGERESLTMRVGVGHPPTACM